jgi:type II secretory pathway pseudopilin PulG
MANQRIKARISRKTKGQNGFSMTETLIAGILLAASLTAVGRMAIAALSGSKMASNRAQIEAAINNNIQAMQKADSYFTYGWISQTQDIVNACQDPPEALKTHLLEAVSEPEVGVITRRFDSTSIPGILLVEYKFEGPEQAIGSELRVLEMNPNFSSECYLS